MPKATVEEIKEGIDSIMKQPQSLTKYKDIGGTEKFNTLLGTLDAWLENNECGALTRSDQDKKLVAQVINQFFAAKFAFGKPPKIGGYPITTLAPLTESPSAETVFKNLTDSWSANKGKFAVVRRDVARVLGIQDKGHAHHGSNFSGTQTLKQIILNLYGGVQGPAEIARVKAVIKAKYKFDA
jgi:ribosomal protein L29